MWRKRSNGSALSHWLRQGVRHRPECQAGSDNLPAPPVRELGASLEGQVLPDYAYPSIRSASSKRSALSSRRRSRLPVSAFLVEVVGFIPSMAPFQSDGSVVLESAGHASHPGSGQLRCPRRSEKKSVRCWAVRPGELGRCAAVDELIPCAWTLHSHHPAGGGHFALPRCLCQDPPTDLNLPRARHLPVEWSPASAHA